MAVQVLPRRTGDCRVVISDRQRKLRSPTNNYLFGWQPVHAERGRGAKKQIAPMSETVTREFVASLRRATCRCRYSRLSIEASPPSRATLAAGKSQLATPSGAGVFDVFERAPATEMDTVSPISLEHTNAVRSALEPFGSVRPGQDSLLFFRRTGPLGISRIPITRDEFANLLKYPNVQLSMEPRTESETRAHTTFGQIVGLPTRVRGDTGNDRALFVERYTSGDKKDGQWARTEFLRDAHVTPSELLAKLWRLPRTIGQAIMNPRRAVRLAVRNARAHP